MSRFKALTCAALLLTAMSCSRSPEEEQSASQKNPGLRKTVTSQHRFGVGAYGSSHVWVVGFEGTVVK